MNRIIPALSRGLLIVGGLLILAGLGWGLWGRVNAPPPPTIGEAGAVVLAVTAPALSAIITTEPTSLPPTATASPTLAPVQASLGEDPTPELLPDWTVTPDQPVPTPTRRPSTPTPASPEGDLRPSETPTALPPTEPPPTEPPPTSSPEPSTATGANADVLHVRAIESADGSWTFHVTVEHPDAGWEDYADG